MSPEFVPSSVSQSLHYDYNQNQNVIFKQLPRTFLNKIESGPHFAEQSIKITSKARWAGRGPQPEYFQCTAFKSGTNDQTDQHQ